MINDGNFKTEGDIKYYLKDMFKKDIYGIEVSADMVSKIIDSIIS